MEGHGNNTGEKLKKNEKIIVIALVVITIICGTIGFKTDEYSFLDALYLTAQLFIIHSGAHHHHPVIYLEIARWMGAGLAVYTVIRIYMMIISKELKSSFFNFKDHIAIIGLNEYSINLLNELINEPVVLIGKQEEGNNFILKNKHILHFDTNDVTAQVLSKGRVQIAKEIYILTKADDYNISMANRIMELASDSSREEITIWLRINDVEKLKFYKRYHQRIKTSEKSKTVFNLHAFNFNEITSQRLIDDYSPDQYIQINEGTTPVHTTIIGDLPLAEHLLSESLKMYHFSNLQKNRITLVNDSNQQSRDDFFARYPDLNMVAELNCLTFNSFLASSDSDDVVLCFVCHEDSILNIRQGLMIRRHFYNTRNNLIQPKIVCLVNNILTIKRDMPEVLDNAKKAGLELVDLNRFFSMKEMFETHREWDKIARVIHGQYITLEQADRKEIWNTISDAEKEQNRYPARHLRIKLRAMGYDLDYSGIGDGAKLDLPDNHDLKLQMAKLEHNRWMAEKMMEGYVSVKNKAIFNRQLKDIILAHPDIVPFSELSEQDIEKDFGSYPAFVEKSKIKLKSFRIPE